MNIDQTQEASVESCPVCGCEPDDRLKWRMGYRILVCPGCDLLFTRPMPTDEVLGEFYAGFLYRKPDEDKRAGLVSAKKQELLKLFGLDKGGCKGLRFLDWGGGTGVAFEAAIALGFDAHYYEIDGQAVGYVRDKLDVADEKIMTDPTQIGDLRFDQVLCDNVIEHVRDPAALIEQLGGYLNPGGILVIKTPNGRGTQLWFYPVVSLLYYVKQAVKHNGLIAGWRLWWNRLWTCDPPRHLYAFSEKNLRTLASQAGYQNSEIGYYPIDLLEYSVIKLVRWPIHSVGDLFKSVAALLVTPVELVTRLVQWGLLRCGWVSPGGIILTLTKPRKDDDRSSLHSS